VTATRTARKISAKTKSSTTKKKKKPIAAKKPLVKKKKKIIKKTPAKKAPIVVPRSMSMPPLRPVSGYVVFLREHIASLPKGYGTEVMRQRFKDTAGLWQALPEHAKEAYKERALALRGQWVENRLNWFKTIDPKILKEINRRKKLKGKSMMHKPKDPNAPWRAPGAFLYYFSDFRKSDSIPGELLQATARRAGKAWHALSDSQRKHYFKMREEAVAIQGSN